MPLGVDLELFVLLLKLLIGIRDGGFYCLIGGDRSQQGDADGTKRDEEPLERCRQTGSGARLHVGRGRQGGQCSLHGNKARQRGAHLGIDRAEARRQAPHSSLAHALESLTGRASSITHAAEALAGIVSTSTEVTERTLRPADLRFQLRGIAADSDDDVAAVYLSH